VNKLVCLSWKYSIRIDIDETAANANRNGLTVIWLYGQSRTYHQEYPLNQIRFIGASLNPKLRVQISPNSTEFFYDTENLAELDEVEKTLCVVEDAERVLNLTVTFASGETRRFGSEIKKPIPSIPMLRLQMNLENKKQETWDKIQNIVLHQINEAFADMSRGNYHLAGMRIESVIIELVEEHQNLMNLAREWNDPHVQEWETKFRKMMADPFGFSMNDIK
jgi:hypothetical protein